MDYVWSLLKAGPCVVTVPAGGIFDNINSFPTKMIRAGLFQEYCGETFVGVMSVNLRARES